MNAVASFRSKTKKRRVPPQPSANENFYQCPACHEKVDKSDLAAIQSHHDHVLHPPLFAYVSLPYFQGLTAR
jgi:hypothetical protein